MVARYRPGTDKLTGMTDHEVTRAGATRSRVRDIALTSGNREASRYRRPARVNAPAMKLIGIKTPAATHDYLLTRFRAACDAAGMTSAEMLDYLLDLRQRDETTRDRLAGNPLAVG